MTLLIFLGVLVSLLILRLLPGLLLRLVLAVPQPMTATMRWAHSRRVGIALPRTSAATLSDGTILAASTPSGGRLKFVLVSSSLLVLVALVTTAFWSWHSTALMMLMR